VNTLLNHSPDWPNLAKQANWSVTKLAKLCKVSSRTLERHFIKLMNKTPKEWMVEHRRMRALELLRDGSSVKETASQLGYRYVNNLSREFKNHWGTSPKKCSFNSIKTG
jgi:AraC family transcriptional activator of pyochelin receptor